MVISGSFGKLFRNFDDLLKLAKDENFKKFLTNPKARALIKNEEFKRAVQEKNVFKLMANQEFVKLLSDPEIRSALEGMNQKFNKTT